MQSNYKLEEVENELRAQIEIALDTIPAVSHLSSHMGTPTANPALMAITEKLSKEYHLPIGAKGAKSPGNFSGNDKSAEEKIESLVHLLENLQPGLWLIVEHPGYDTPEMRSIGHIGYWNVAWDRDGVTKAFTSKKVKEVIQRRNIRLISHKDLYDEK